MEQELNCNLPLGYHNIDCMELIRNLPDKCIDLAIVDPPFGDGGGTWKGTDKTRFGGWFDRYRGQAFTASNTESGGVKRTGGQWANKYGKKIIAWDVAPGKEYFEELFRISRNQIIWGGNYFELPPCRCFVIWRKTNIPENFSMSMCEYAWTSFNDNAKVFEMMSQNQVGRFHPTQKPIKLYKWLLSKYAKEGDIILDTHVGSASSLIACEEMGFKYIGCELDAEYYRKSVERMERHRAQITLNELLENE